jgi:arginine-tRNA-protein transferase
MQVFYSEYLKDYSSYTFSYAVYALQEKEDDLSDLYKKGFLPYTGDIEENREIYYLARSTRVVLDRFELSSENRRVLRKLEGHETKINFKPKTSFHTDDSSFLNYCLSYAEKRYKGGSMQEKRLRYVIDRDCATHVAEFTLDGELTGYLLAGLDQDSLHFWFSFFNADQLSHFPVGKWMMLETIMWAKSQGKKYVYLGTCYGPSALYKVRDFKGVEFFDGHQWRTDIKTLKIWCKNDSEKIKTDRFKLS